VPGGKDFCKALHKFAGVENDEDNARRPKGFVEDIDDVMEAFQRANLQTVQPVKKKVRKAAARGKKAKTVEEVVKEQKSCIKELDTFFEKRGYLPAKDITHLLVFQSRKTCDLFKTILEARVASSSLLMEGSIETMQMFDSSMKTGRPIFIMTGTGGASSKIDLVLQHMKYRKQIEMREIFGGPLKKTKIIKKESNFNPLVATCSLSCEAGAAALRCGNAACGKALAPPLLQCIKCKSEAYCCKACQVGDPACPRHALRVARAGARSCPLTRTRTMSPSLSLPPPDCRVEGRAQARVRCDGAGGRGSDAAVARCAGGGGARAGAARAPAGTTAEQDRLVASLDQI